RDFMMRFELGLEKPDPARARTSALVIGGAYVAGGLIPLTPYMLMASARSALPWSALVTLTALAVFGWVKGNFAGTTPLRSALQTVLIGGLAAGAAFLIARLIADRKSTRLNSSHDQISYAVFCLKKKNKSTRCNRNQLLHYLMSLH